MEKTRKNEWDNLKALLIFLVVLAHYYGTGAVYKGLGEGLWLIPNAVYTFIYLFHMPLFSFVSGYFSKNAEKARKHACADLLLPYLIVNTIYVWMDAERVNPLFAPYGPMWYLLALFLWRMVLPDVGKLRLCWLWGLGFSLLCLLLTPGKNYVSLRNTITFFPCFLLGFWTNEERVEKLRTVPHWICATVLAVIGGAVVVMLGPLQHSYGSLSFFGRYYELSRSSLKYVGLELGRYGAAVLMGACVINLIPSKEGWYTRLGKNSLITMLLHSVPHLRELLDAWNPLPEQPLFTLLWWTVLAAAVTLVSGSTAAGKGYAFVMQWIKRIIPRRTGQ